MCVCAAAIPVGIVVVRGDCDLETCRLYIDRLQEVNLHFLFPLLLLHEFMLLVMMQSCSLPVCPVRNDLLTYMLKFWM